MSAAQADRPPVDDPVEFRRWLIKQYDYSPAWLDQRLSPAEVVSAFPEIASTVNSLKTMRCKGRGPRVIKLGKRCVYLRHDLIRFLEAHAVEGAA